MRAILNEFENYVRDNTSEYNFDIYTNRVPNESTKTQVATFRWISGNQSDLSTLCGHKQKTKRVGFYFFNDTNDDDVLADGILAKVSKLLDGYYNFNGVDYKIINTKVVVDNGFTGIDPATGLGVYSLEFEVIFNDLR